MTRRHWSEAGSYRRYAQRRRHGGAVQVDIPRYDCNIIGRTFSLLHDSLLPYHAPTAGQLVEWLHALLVDRTPTNTLARRLDLPRKTLADLKGRFLSTASTLRLPGVEHALEPADLLKRLASQTGDQIGRLFRDWKEIEPKHSVVGLYAR